MYWLNRQDLTAAAGWCCLGLMAVGLWSCGGPARPPATEVSGYQQLRDRLGDYDFSPLSGRHIVIDPGHGGSFRGAIGPGGLSEAEVNLGVALYLRGLLEWAGSEVHLTRSADYDFLTPADSSLAVDLAARIALVDSLQPDVFLSIHHNSNAALDRDLNETQTYYPVGRDGADLDLARSIHKYLVRNLQIQPAKIMAGNFYVLRNSPVPAVLGEPSMISNPIIEKRLSLAAKQELEAKAYFLGLLEYFAGGMPRWVSVPQDSFLSLPARPLTWRFEPGNGGPPLDPESIQLLADGRPQAFSLSADGTLLTWRCPPDLSDGTRGIELTARNVKGRATPLWSAVWKGSQPFGFDTRLWLHASVAKGLFCYRSRGPELAEYPPLKLEWEIDLGYAEATLPVYPGKRGWILLDLKKIPRYFHISSWQSDVCTKTVYEPERRALQPGWRWQMILPPADYWPDAVVPGGAWRLRLLEGSEWLSYQPEFLDPTSPVLPVRNFEPFWIEADGALPIFADADHREPWAAPGGAPPDTFRWRPILPELIGKVVVLDPAGGGSEADGAGPMGTRGADLNLLVAEKTAALLRGAGAEVVLTRRNEQWLPPEEKVLLANRCGADLFLTVQRCREPGHRFSVHHHFTSLAGLDWSRHFASAVAPLIGRAEPAPPTGNGGVLTAPSYAYLLRHTACPALQVGLEMPATIGSEERLLEPSYQQAEARALFLSIVALLAGEPVPDDLLQPGDLIAAHPADFPPLERIDWIKLDGNFIWLPPRWSRSRNDGVSLYRAPGLPFRGFAHTCEVHAGSSWQLWALHKDPTGRIRLERLLENR